MADRPRHGSNDDLTPTQIIELYREQIRYLLNELHRIGWTPYPEEPHEAQ